MAPSPARLLLLVAALLGTSVALAAQRTYDKRLEAPPGGQLIFETDIGSVTVVGHDAPEVVVHAVLQGSESFLNRIRISARQSPSGVTISAHGKLGSGWLDWLRWAASGSDRAQFTIEVPRNYPVDLRTGGGSVQVRDLNASVHAHTSGGGAVVRDVAGAVSLSTSGGGIQAKHITGSGELSSSGGSVDVTDSVGDLELSTSGGGAQLLNDDGKIHAVTSGGSIRADLRANRGISLDTSGGGITLLLPPDTQGSIEARSDGGGIQVDFPLSTTQIDGDNHLAGTIGGGGPPIDLHSSGGGIRVAQEK